MQFEWQEFLGAFDVPWEARGNEWISRIAEYMTEHHGITGHQMGAHGSFIRVTVSVDRRGGNADTCLILIPLPEEKVVVLACGMECADERLISEFRAALKSAKEEICKPAKPHKWSAIIGEAPSVFQGNPQQISEGFSLDGLKLSSTERYFWQPGVSASPTVSSFHLHSSIPILVRGTSVGYDWAHTAKRDAAERLGLLVAFLSVVWNIHLDVEEGPVPLELGEVRLPDRHPGLKEFDLLPVLESSTVGNLAVPEWLSGAWLMTKRRSKIKSSVLMYMEGLRVEDRHPSLALVAYVSAVESVSLMLFEEKRCKECSNHLDVGNKFLETLKLVTAGPDFELLRLVYGNRSKTVHQGKLHGTELALGAFSFGMLSNDSATSFKLNSLGIMKGAARKLLVMAMRSQLPKKTHYTKREPSS
ncbi:hypothetical protein ACFZB5_16085 [Streptomyces nodosus]|uniref:hypothetical protein n=1 Tax=Streptomyces nodosus TaxID=40318 RepID=UPI0036E95F38